MSDRTAEVLRDIPGGDDLLDWMGGEANFGDAELVDLVLDRGGGCRLSLQVQTRARGPSEVATVTFLMTGMIDVEILGFSYQNVIGGFALRQLQDPVVSPHERGTEVAPPNIEIELLPCFGAKGSIRATIKAIELRP